MPLEFHEQSDKNLVLVKASGKLTDEDYQKLVPRMDQFIQQHGQVSLLVEMEDFHGWDLHGAWDDLKLGLKHRKDLDRIAMVGDKKWQQWMTKIADLFTAGDVRYFDHNQINSAKSWIEAA